MPTIGSTVDNSENLAFCKQVFDKSELKRKLFNSTHITQERIEEIFNLAIQITQKTGESMDVICKCIDDHITFFMLQNTKQFNIGSTTAEWFVRLKRHEFLPNRNVYRNRVKSILHSPHERQQEEYKMLLVTWLEDMDMMMKEIIPLIEADPTKEVSAYLEEADVEWVFHNLSLQEKLSCTKLIGGYAAHIRYVRGVYEEVFKKYDPVIVLDHLIKGEFFLQRPSGKIRLEQHAGTLVFFFERVQDYKLFCGEEYNGGITGEWGCLLHSSILKDEIFEKSIVFINEEESENPQQTLAHELWHARHAFLHKRVKPIDFYYSRIREEAITRLKNNQITDKNSLILTLSYGYNIIRKEGIDKQDVAYKNDLQKLEKVFPARMTRQCKEDVFSNFDECYKEYQIKLLDEWAEFLANLIFALLEFYKSNHQKVGNILSSYDGDKLNNLVKGLNLPVKLHSSQESLLIKNMEVNNIASVLKNLDDETVRYEGFKHTFYQNLSSLGRIISPEVEKYLKKEYKLDDDQITYMSKNFQNYGTFCLSVKDFLMFLGKVSAFHVLSGDQLFHYLYYANEIYEQSDYNIQCLNSRYMLECTPLLFFFSTQHLKKINTLIKPYLKNNLSSKYSIKRILENLELQTEGKKDITGEELFASFGQQFSELVSKSTDEQT